MVIFCLDWKPEASFGFEPFVVKSKTIILNASLTVDTISTLNNAPMAKRNITESKFYEGIVYACYAARSDGIVIFCYEYSAESDPRKDTTKKRLIETRLSYLIKILLGHAHKYHNSPFDNSDTVVYEAIQSHSPIRINCRTTNNIFEFPAIDNKPESLYSYEPKIIDNSYHDLTSEYKNAARALDTCVAVASDEKAIIALSSDIGDYSRRCIFLLRRKFTREFNRSILSSKTYSSDPIYNYSVSLAALDLFGMLLMIGFIKSNEGNMASGIFSLFSYFVVCALFVIATKSLANEYLKTTRLLEFFSKISDRFTRTLDLKDLRGRRDTLRILFSYCAAFLLIFYIAGDKVHSILSAFSLSLPPFATQFQVPKLQDIYWGLCQKAPFSSGAQNSLIGLYFFLPIGVFIRLARKRIGKIMALRKGYAYLLYGDIINEIVISILQRNSRDYPQYFSRSLQPASRILFYQILDECGKFAKDIFIVGFIALVFYFLFIQLPLAIHFCSL